MTWRAAAATAIDAQTAALQTTLDELDNAHAVLEQLDRPRVCHEIRAVASSLRAEITTLAAQARELRTEPSADRDLPGFSMALTTRHVRSTR